MAMIQDEGEEARKLRPQAVATLATMGSAAKAALPLLPRILEQNREAAMARVEGGPASDAHRRAWSVLYTLGTLGPEAQATLPILVQMAGGEDFMTSVMARWACIRVAPAEQALLEGVLQQCQSADALEREQAIWILSMLKPKSPVVQSALLDKLDDRCWRNRLRAATALAEDGLGGEKARSILISGLTCGDSHLLHEVKKALHQTTAMNARRHESR
jgi:hypothetical protein